MRIENYAAGEEIRYFQETKRLIIVFTKTRLRQFNVVHVFTITLISTLILSSHLYLCVPSGLFD
jgi:hypothetical protein